MQSAVFETNDLSSWTWLSLGKSKPRAFQISQEKHLWIWRHDQQKREKESINSTIENEKLSINKSIRKDEGTIKGNKEEEAECAIDDGNFSN